MKTGITVSNLNKITDSDFRFIVEYVSKNYGIDLSRKRTLVEARLARELKKYELNSYSQYVNILRTQPKSDNIESLINQLTTNYSYFCRESDHFDYLQNIVIPELLNKKKSSIKIWSAGCSTGEEPYNIAMAIHTALKTRSNLVNAHITATDVSTRALNIAKQGIYKESELSNMPKYWKTNYMKKLSDGNYQVIDTIRKMIDFSQFNLISPVYKKNYYDIIFCRNVMIYFKSETSENIVNKFYNATTENGYLFIGHSETINRLKHKYAYISPSIYKKGI